VKPKFPPGRIIRAFVLWLSLVLVSTTAAQVITTFTSLTAFNTAIGAVPVTLEDFTSSTHFPISTGVLNSATNLPDIGIVPGMIQPGVTYSTAIGTGSFFNIDAGGYFTTGPFLDSVYNAAVIGPLTITFNGTVSAFGFETNTTAWTAFNITINFVDATSYTNPAVPVASSSSAFYGFQSTSSDISSILIINSSATSGMSFAIDNFRFTNSHVTAVPEP
jgi:hypothetical protein